MNEKMMPIKICVLGDICPNWGFPKQFATGKAENVFHDILSVLQSADVTVANLESPATNREKKLSKNSVNLKAQPKDVIVLKSSGIDGVALANNHILDYGTEGLKDTIKQLQQNKMFYYGLSDAENRTNAHYCIVKGKTIGFLAFAEQEFNCAVDYGFGAALWDDLETPRLIQKVKAHCDYLIVQYHGGIEHYIYPSPYLQKKCRVMADSGADFITCQHSHIIGTHENYKGVEILYGQGNTIFGKDSISGWNEGLIADISIGANISVNYIPVIAKEDGEYLASERESKMIIDSFNENSKKIADKEFILKQWQKFCTKHKDEYLPLQFAWGRISNKLNRISKGRMISLMTGKSARRNAMNMLRCDAHREVVQTILEREYYHE